MFSMYDRELASIPQGSRIVGNAVQPMLHMIEDLGRVGTEGAPLLQGTKPMLETPNLHFYRSDLTIDPQRDLVAILGADPWAPIGFFHEDERHEWRQGYQFPGDAAAQGIESVVSGVKGRQHIGPRLADTQIRVCNALPAGTMITVCGLMQGCCW